MTSLVEEIMTTDPRSLPGTASLEEAAREMLDCDCGSVVVIGDDGQVTGILTDRDIVIRAVAEGLNPADCEISEICSSELEVLSPQDSTSEATKKMRASAVKRLPVIEDSRPVGIVSLSDLAVEADPDSVLGNISQAEPNH